MLALLPRRTSSAASTAGLVMSAASASALGGEARMCGIKACGASRNLDSETNMPVWGQ